MEGYITERTAKELVAEILLQAVFDWKALNYGEFRETMFTGSVIKRSEVLAFFRSKDFELMADYVGINPSVARKALKIPERGDSLWR